MKRNDNLKRNIVAFVLLIAITLCSGCAPSSQNENAFPASEPDQGEEYALFIPMSRLKTVKVSKSEIMEYESKYPECNSTWYRDQLSGEELYAYNAFLYALENCYIEIHLFSKNPEMDYLHIREMLSLDSPFLEQNYFFGEFVRRKNNTTWMGYEYVIEVWNFNEDYWELKMKALEKSREIVDNIPQEFKTPVEKMEYLYNYVKQNVKYENVQKNYSYSDEPSLYYPNYLYDAVINGATNCDGYTNMLNLLFNLIDAECCEVTGSNVKDIGKLTLEELAEVESHTWVAAKVDEAFYNFDATFDDTGVGEQNKYFGVSDDLIGVKYKEHPEYSPECFDTSRDYIYADKIVSTMSGNEKQVKESIMQWLLDTDNEYYLVIQETLQDSEVNNITNEIFRNLYYGKQVSASWYCDNKSTIINFIAE